MANNVNFCVWSVVSEHTLAKTFSAEAKGTKTVAGGFSLDESPFSNDQTRSKSKFPSMEEARTMGKVPRSVTHCAC